MTDIIRTWRYCDYALEMRDTGTYDSRGCTRIAYTFEHKGTVIFEDSDFHGSPLHADDSNATVAALLGFLSLRSEDTDSDYFENYSASQIEFAEVHGEHLAMLAHELSELQDMPYHTD